MQFLDNVFDKKCSDEVAHELKDIAWKPGNVANRVSWPYGYRGSHLLLGANFFRIIDSNKIIYNQDIELSFKLIDAFNVIADSFNRNISLREISANLQFKEMNGSLHTDGNQNQFAYIYMLANDYLPSDVGGEFYNDTTKESVPFVHGRLIEIQANDLHCGKAFNVSRLGRYSIKFLGEIVNG